MEKATCPVAPSLLQSFYNGDDVKTKGLLKLAADPSSILADDLPHLLDECTRIEKQIEAVRQRAKELIANGETISGWRVLDVIRHKIIDQEAAFTQIWTDYGKEVAVRCIKLSLPMAAAAVAGSAQITKKQAQERLSRTLDKLIEVAIHPRLWRQSE